jgi:hypothetical protein
MSRIIFINAKARTVTIETNTGLEYLQGLVGGFIESVANFRDPNGRRHMLLVNEEARIQKPPLPYGFNVNGNGVLIGNGVIVATDEDGERADVTLPLDAFAKQVHWLDLTSVSYLNKINWGFKQ